MNPSQMLSEFKTYEPPFMQAFHFSTLQELPTLSEILRRNPAFQPDFTDFDFQK
jgi:hypothetical protein